MSIKKFYAKMDTTITNAYKGDLSTRAVDSNMGLSDSLEIFFIFGQNPDENAGLIDKLEESRILLKFDVDEIRSHYGNQFPNDVKFVLKMSNAEHPYTLARNYDVKVYSLSESFMEGTGLDMESYLDEGPASWNSRITSVSWTTPGALQQADIDNGPVAVQSFDTGEEDLEIDITNHIKGYFDDLALVDNGFIVVIDEGLTGGASEQNYYTKKFFSRSSEFFFKRPVIEARSSEIVLDDRGNFYAENKAYSEEQNKQRVYLYNSIGGVLSNFTQPDVDEELYVRFYSDEERTTLVDTDSITPFIQATNQSSGIYYVELILQDNSVSEIYDQWYYAANGGTEESGRTIVHEGLIKVQQRRASTSIGDAKYISNLTNLKSSYSREEKPRIRVYTRQKDWNPTIYTVASNEIENVIVEKMYYKIVRLIDDEDVIPYGIGTENNNNEHTRVSYDSRGGYFDFDMSLLEDGYMYGVKLTYLVDGDLVEQEEIFKFRVG